MAIIPFLSAVVGLALLALPAMDERAEALIRDVAVFDPARGVFRTHQDVEIRARIHDVRSSTGPVVPAKYVIDGSGKFAIPGLVDTRPSPRVLTRESAGRVLAEGVTSAWAAGLDQQTIEAWQRDLDYGRFYGPRLIGAASGDARSGRSSAGPPVHDRLLDMVAAGTPAAAALRAFTMAAAGQAGRAADLGSIEAGKIADLIILSADPLADIRHVRAIDAVIFRGEVLTRAHLNQLAAGRLRPGEAPPDRR